MLGITDRITFEGRTVADLTRDCHHALDDYLKDSEATGRTAQKPGSDKMMLRVSPKVHGSALIAAKLAGNSLNQWAVEVIREAANIVPSAIGRGPTIKTPERLPQPWQRMRRLAWNLFRKDLQFARPCASTVLRFSR